MKLVSLGRPQRAPHPRHLQTWQRDASRGPGGGLSLNPPLQHLELPASRAVGSQVLLLEGPQPHPGESAEGTNPTQAGTQGWGWGQRGQRHG